MVAVQSFGSSSTASTSEADSVASIVGLYTLDCLGAYITDMTSGLIKSA